MFRHPSYYKNLRKLARNREPVIICSAAPDTDQAISKQQATASSTRSPGSSSKPQAASIKHQAPEDS